MVSFWFQGQECALTSICFGHLEHRLTKFIFFVNSVYFFKKYAKDPVICFVYCWYVSENVSGYMKVESWQLNFFVSSTYFTVPSSSFFSLRKVC